MLRTVDEWYKVAIERGTDGSMVFDILKDWKEEKNNVILCPECYKDISEEEFSVDSLVSGHKDTGYNCPHCEIDVYIYKVEEE